MKKQLSIYDGSGIVTYEETDEKKQQLWDAFIKWCHDHNATSGECIQSDSFVIDAPDFMADAIDDIIQFEWV